ncbi:hypothetical protein CLV58_109158 [Spirosoma oryzae]|uniref:Uncharacterized protein n=1 Tax=Spirosoma oryzae TaxID=1469603 RepID=A0A2T0SYB6_9BACT|nr:hypothetical protein [Spirosoma oryzae]PRY38431.1 hypothetical protein CLV58_109158 [Spirosoma oryzae]
MNLTVGDLQDALYGVDRDLPVYLDKTTPEIQARGLFNLATVKVAGVYDVPGLKDRVCLISFRDFSDLPEPGELPDFLQN